MRDLNVQLVGLCCGNVASYIRTMAETLGRTARLTILSWHVKTLVANRFNSSHFQRTIQLTLNVQQNLSRLLWNTSEQFWTGWKRSLCDTDGPWVRRSKPTAVQQKNKLQNQGIYMTLTRTFVKEMQVWKTFARSCWILSSCWAPCIHARVVVFSLAAGQTGNARDAAPCSRSDVPYDENDKSWKVFHFSPSDLIHIVLKYAYLPQSMRVNDIKPDRRSQTLVTRSERPGSAILRGGSTNMRLLSRK